MNYEINSTIEQLQKSLEKVDSARKQVESVTTSYAELETAVKGFTDNLANISNHVKTLISNISSERSNSVRDLEASLKALEQISNDLVTSFSSSCELISNKFSEQTSSCIDDAKKEVANLHLEVAKLEGVHETISTAIKEIGTLNKGVQEVLKELKSSQTAQDVVLDKIAEDVASSLSSANKIEQSTATYKTAIESAIKASETALATNIQSVCTSLGQQVSQCESNIKASILQLEANMKQQFAQSDANIKQQLSQAEATISQQNEDIKKLQSRNFIFIIIAIVVAIIAVVTNFIG